VRSGLGSEGIDSTAGEDLPGGPAAWSRLFALPVSIRAVAEAEAVVVAGLDTRYSFLRGRRTGAPRLAPGGAAGDDRRPRLEPRASGRQRDDRAPGEEAQALCRLLHAVRIGDELDTRARWPSSSGRASSTAPAPDQLVSELGR